MPASLTPIRVSPPKSRGFASPLTDTGDDLYSALNKVQENLLRGGLARRSASGRLVRTRRISSIKEDVRINSGLWDLAAGVLAA